MNIKALNRSVELSKKGVDIKSKFLLLVIGILNQSANWKKINLLLKYLASLLSKQGIFSIGVKQDNRYVHFSLRENNNSDYQSLFECFAGMYKIPPKHIQYALDGGANIGFFSINLFVENSFLREIICVEPNPFNIVLLAPNTNKIPVKIVNAALSNFTGKATFNFKEHNTGHIAGSPGHTYYHNQTLVDCIMLSDLIPPSWDMKTTLIKLDIEGQEYKVFENMFTCNIFPQYIAAELHDYLNVGGKELVDKIRSYGYEVILEGNGEEGNVCRQIFAERKNEGDINILKSSTI